MGIRPPHTDDLALLHPEVDLAADAAIHAGASNLVLHIESPKRLSQGFFRESGGRACLDAFAATVTAGVFPTAELRRHKGLKTPVHKGKHPLPLYLLAGPDTPSATYAAGGVIDEDGAALVHGKMDFPKTLLVDRVVAAVLFDPYPVLVGQILELAFAVGIADRAIEVVLRKVKLQGGSAVFHDFIVRGGDLHALLH
jgi:hypothetical protein